MVKLLKGRYGPYVSDGSTNATVPNGTDPMSVTLEQALSLIAEREAKGGGKKKKKKAAPKAKAPAKAKAAPKEKTKAKAPAAKKKKKTEEPVPAE
jgi:DNA topoisomerase-1